KEENDNIFKEIQSYICNRIVYLGERNDVPSMMNESDAFCLFSIFEGMPVTLLEALSVGCVPICTPVGGVPEALENGKVGFLAETPTVEACCKSVNDFLALDDNRLMTMKENVRKKFTEFDIRNTAKEYVDYYKEIINKRS
ncbi:MAG TPA: glycosyltransferase, partial [Paludibacteraceae bacterium]|nr:glycosyltransferase [Paludibacteraceae bacterium]